MELSVDKSHLQQTQEDLSEKKFKHNEANEEEKGKDYEEIVESPASDWVDVMPGKVVLQLKFTLSTWMSTSMETYLWGTSKLKIGTVRDVTLDKSQVSSLRS